MQGPYPPGQQKKKQATLRVVGRIRQQRPAKTPIRRTALDIFFTALRGNIYHSLYGRKYKDRLDLNIDTYRSLHFRPVYDSTIPSNISPKRSQNESRVVGVQGSALTLSGLLQPATRKLTAEGIFPLSYSKQCAVRA